MNNDIKFFAGIVIALMVVVGGFIWFPIPTSKEDQLLGQQAVKTVELNPLNATYFIDGRQIMMTNGLSQVALPGSEGRIVTRYFGNSVTADFDNNGIDDIAFLLTQETTGSGKFYYLAAITNGDRVTNVSLIGDRIAPQTTEVRDGMIVVNYADRRPDEPFTATPSVGQSKYFKIINLALTEVEPIN